jgi:hypothetical protein
MTARKFGFCNAVTGFYCGHTGGVLPGRMLALPKAVEIAAVPSASNNGMKIPSFGSTALPHPDH